MQYYQETAAEIHNPKEDIDLRFRCIHIYPFLASESTSQCLYAVEAYARVFTKVKSSSCALAARERGADDTFDEVG